jgi:ABC-type bacteriocin/lantibiotic exporter with double-glycine peptidase domain
VKIKINGFPFYPSKAVLPCIVHWRQDHFVVAYKIKARMPKNGFKGKVLMFRTS